MSNITTNYILTHLFDQDLFYVQPKQLSTLLHLNLQKTYDIIHRLKKNGSIQEIEKGKYLVTGYDRKRILSHPLFIATHIVVPSYVSYWSALNYYNWTEQAPKTILLATTKQKKPMQVENYLFKYIKISKEKLYGYTKETVGDFPAFIAEKEKTIIDALDLPRYAGGISEIAHCISKAINEIDTKKLIDYAKQFPNRSMVSRLGYLSEQNGLKLSALKPYMSSSFVLLNPKRKQSTQWDTTWNINVNDEV
ncbi:MAG: type IV toxin-antitoxin system AbiEi family antitoxin [Methanobacteriota archaeon]